MEEWFVHTRNNFKGVEKNTFAVTYSPAALWYSDVHSGARLWGSQHFL